MVLTLSGGLGLAWVDSTFAFNETLQLPGGGQLVNSGSGTESDLLVGGYAAANVSYLVTDAWRLFLGAQYRNLGSFHQTVKARRWKWTLGMPSIPRWGSVTRSNVWNFGGRSAFTGSGLPGSRCHRFANWA